MNSVGWTWILVGGFTAATGWAQTPSFLHQMGGVPGSSEEMEVVIERSSGDLLMAGMTDAYSATGDADGFVVVTDRNGQIRWAKTYGDPTDNMLIDAKELPGGNLLMGGWTLTDGTYDFWVLKLDINGNVIWERRFGGPGDEQVWSVDADTGGYMVVGGTSSFGAGLTDVWVLKLDTLGNILWQRVYGTTGDDAPPGAYNEYVARGLISSHGHWMLSGITDGAGQGATDMFLLRISPVDGSPLWAYTYGQSQDEALWSFTEAEGGSGYYLPGNTVNPSTLDGDLWVVKVDTAGHILWQQTFGLPGVWDEALNAAATVDGLVMASYMEAGAQDWYATLLRVAGNGTLQWARTYKTGHLDWANDARSLPNGALIMVGVTTDTTTWDQDILLARLGLDGDLPGCPAVGGLTPVSAPTSALRAVLPLQTAFTSVSALPMTSTVQGVSPALQVVCTGTAVNEPSPGGECRAFHLRIHPGGAVTLTVPGPSPVRLWVVDAAGRTHRTTVLRPGRHTLRFSTPSFSVLHLIVEALNNGQKVEVGTLTLP